MPDIRAIKHVATIVSAYVDNHNVATEQLPALIASVHSAFGQLGKAPSTAIVALVPAVSVRASVKHGAITCLDCGWSGKMLKRHLTTAHSTTVDAYRTKWGLTSKYPFVAPDYASRRSALAKQFGLGRR